MNSQSSGAGVADMQESTERFMEKLGRPLAALVSASPPNSDHQESLPRTDGA